jgi:hypothetical protein
MPDHSVAEHPPLTAADGAACEASLSETPEGWQAHVCFMLHTGPSTYTEPATRQFEREEDAKAWIAGLARARGFTKIKLRKAG